MMVRMVPLGPLGMVSQNTNYWQCTMPRAGVKIILHQMNLPRGKADHACIHRITILAVDLSVRSPR